jgi:hypothetical protein
MRRDGPPRAGLADLPAEANRAQILLADQFDGSTDERLTRTVAALASLMGIPPDAITVTGAADGQTRLDLSIQALESLRNLLRANDPRLRMLKTTRLVLEVGFGRREEWVLLEGRFRIQPPQTGPARPPKPVRIHMLPPFLVAALVGCVAYAAAELAQIFWSSIDQLSLILAPMVVAVESGYSHQLLRHRHLFVDEIVKFRTIELLLLLVLIKAATYIGQSPMEILEDVKLWPDDPLRIVNVETALTIVLCLVAWWATTGVMNDLRRLGEPPERSRYYVPPLHSLAGRFFWGGGILLFLVGLNSVGAIGHLETGGPWLWALLRRLRQSTLPDMVLVLLVYHVLGIILLGQVRLALLRKQWQAQSLPVDETLGRRWLAASLAIVALALLVAFLLPTGYTVGFLRTVSIAVAWISRALFYLGSLLLFLFGLLLAPLLALLLGSGRSYPSAGSVPRFRPPADPAIAAGPPPEWLLFARTLLFWGLVAAVVIYVVIAYFRDHPELLAWLAEWRPFAFIGRVSAAIRRLWRRWETTIHQRLATRDRRTPDQAPRTAGSFRFLRLSALTPRERILYYYWSLLRRAEQWGFPRRPPQTPREYRTLVETRLPQVGDEIGELTEAFIEARYSLHPVNQTDAQVVRQNWQKVQGALRLARRTPGRAGESHQDDR